MANTFGWGGREWGYGDLGAFQDYLAAHGANYGTWAENHPVAATILEQSPRTYKETGGYNEGSSGLPAAPTPSGGGDSGGGDTGGGSAGAGSGSGATTSNQPNAPTDWSGLLGFYGLPQDVINQLNLIWQQSGSNPQAAVLLAQAYVRGTQWYKTTYPSIQQGINAGLFGDEQGYRTYQNSVNQLFQQYFGRAATSAELTYYIGSGTNVGQVSQHLQSQALQGTISDPLKALFTRPELQALTDEQAGIDSALGQQITQKANLAIQVGQLYRDFYGRAISRGELDSLTQEGLDATTVARQFATQANLNAMNPAVVGLFTSDELHQMALQAAGGQTQDGTALQQMASLAAQLNQVYQTYHGTNVTRDELNQAYSQGFSAQQVSNALQTGTIFSSLPSYLGGLFTTDELHQIAAQESGQSDTATGRTLVSLAQNADQYNSAYQTYMGRNVSRDELGQYVGAGINPGDVAKQLAAGQFAGALPASIQGMFTPEELQRAGLAASGASGESADQRLLNLVQSAGSYNAVSQQYTGSPIARGVLEGFYNQGVSATQYAHQQAGSAYANANRGDIQQVSGSFGQGLLSDEQLQQLGQESTGYDTPQGADLLAQFQKAQQRLAGVFRGVLGSPAVTALGQRTSPDVAA